MANALIMRQSLVALKTESTAGTAESLANADAGINCYDAAYTPDVTMSERPAQGTYDANLPSIAGRRAGRITFRTDLFGTDSSALWFARILLHAGFTTSSNVATAVGSAGLSTATVSVYVDGIEHSLAGAVVSSLQIDFDNGSPIYASVEYVGKYAAPTDAALLTPTYPSNQPERFAGGNLTLGGTTMLAFSGSIRIENEVSLRPDPTSTSGIFHAQITRQNITAEINTEATLESIRPDFATWILETAQTLALTGEGSLVVSIPGAQYQNIQPGDTEGIHTRSLTFRHTGTSAATITV